MLKKKSIYLCLLGDNVLFFLFSTVNSVFISSCTRDIQKCVSASKHVISFLHGRDLSLSNLPLSVETHMHTPVIYIFIYLAGY